MEEIVVGLQQIANSMGQNPVPAWLTIMGIVLPVLLSGITIVLSVRMDRQNKELQKQLHNRDVINQSRECMLEIYNTYISALNIALQADKCVADVFSTDQSYYQWGMSVDNMQMNVMSAYNRAKLIVGTDTEMVNYLKNTWKAFAELNFTIREYVNTGFPTMTIQNAWVQFAPKYGICAGDYVSLLRNRPMREEFIKLCENTYTQEIQEKIAAYKSLVSCDEFDEFFEKYVRIEKL